MEGGDAKALPLGGEMTDISLEVEQKKKKVPRRLIHCSDGILEEYSTDEEEDTKPQLPPVDPKTLTWGPWVWHVASVAAWKTYLAADTCGEKLAWFFGITSPKYQSAIDEYYRLQRQVEEEEEEEKRYHERRQNLTTVQVQQTTQPTGTTDNSVTLEKY